MSPRDSPVVPESKFYKKNRKCIFFNAWALNAFDKPINAVLLKDTIKLDSKLIWINSFKPLKKCSAIWFILLFCSLNSRRDVKPVNVAESMDSIWLESKPKTWREVRPVNAVGWMDVSWLSFKYKYCRDVKPWNVAESMDDSLLE